MLPHSACLLRWSFANFFPGLALNHSPPNLCLLSSWNNKHEPL
jgi:hypothetical protein